MRRQMVLGFFDCKNRKQRQFVGKFRIVASRYGREFDCLFKVKQPK